MTISAPPHIRLLNLLCAIRNMSPFDVLSADEEELLRMLISRWHARETTAASEIMRDLAGVSQTTAYRRLIALRDKGMIVLRVDDNDRRVKHAEPTLLAEDYASRISYALGTLMGQPRGA